ncbi:MAG: hypothetical protein R6V06_09080 [Kiritimatiellia bacterium]
MTGRFSFLTAAVFCTLLSHAWQPGETIPEEIAPINAPFKMPQLARPVFPDRTFNIRNYGARECSWSPGPRIKSTEAISEAIADCHRQGGGTVLIPEGEWITGASVLKAQGEEAVQWTMQQPL